MAHKVLREAAQWLADSGRKLWDESELQETDIAARAASRELVIGFADGEAVACFYLLHEDPAFWPHARAGEALYVHRLAVTRAASGKGWSRALLDWATEDARRRGRAFVRLDTELRPKLLALYQSAGFARIDHTPIVVGGHEVVRFERAV